MTQWNRFGIHENQSIYLCDSFTHLAFKCISKLDTFQYNSKTTQNLAENDINYIVYRCL